MGMSVIPIFLFVGDLNLNSVIKAQTGMQLGFLPNWFVIKAR
jgi:hypothetical protein